MKHFLLRSILAVVFLLTLMLGAARPEESTRYYFMEKGLAEQAIDRLTGRATLTPLLRLKLRRSLASSSNRLRCRDHEVNVELKPSVATSWRRQLQSSVATEDELKSPVPIALQRAVEEGACDEVARADH
ncbi:MAG TPA: hypothetical protein VGO56_06945 [Pyrinomonadaceae bacterium]|jgi:hypothetical protein|nr:hypothetical protein [Pyrinomonadaceae bacterium]